MELIERSINRVTRRSRPVKGPASGQATWSNRAVTALLRTHAAVRVGIAALAPRAGGRHLVGFLAALRRKRRAFLLAHARIAAVRGLARLDIRDGQRLALRGLLAAG